MNHIKDCQLGNNWEQCPACLEYWRETSQLQRTRSNRIEAMHDRALGRLLELPEPTTEQRLAALEEQVAQIRGFLNI